MKIFQVKYNQEYYCYYKSEKKELFNEKINLYKSYTDCMDEIKKIDGYEFLQISKALIKYFKEKI
jgi:hypothetical protein